MAHLVRLPQERDLLREPRLDVGALRPRQQGIVEAVELGRDSDVRKQDRASRGLSGMRGQDEPHRDVARAALELVRRNVLQELERMFERVAGGAGGGRGLAAPPDPVVLLRDVRELEVESERAQDELLLLGPDRPDRLAHVADDPALPRGARERSHALDGLEQPVAVLLDENRAERLAEEADVPPELRRAAQAVAASGLASAARSATTSPTTTSAGWGRPCASSGSSRSSPSTSSASASVPRASTAAGVFGALPLASSRCTIVSTWRRPMKKTSVPGVCARCAKSSSSPVAECPLTSVTCAATPRCVTGMSNAAGTEASAATPGPTSNATPASASVIASSPPRPKTKGSPPFRRTVSSPSCPSSTSSPLIASWSSPARGTRSASSDASATSSGATSVS